jgi:hypothetical protein
MSVRAWHPGKLVLIWGVGVGITVLAISGQSEWLFFVGLLVLAVAFLTTWKWLSARETALVAPSYPGTTATGSPNRAMTLALQLVGIAMAAGGADAPTEIAKLIDAAIPIERLRWERMCLASFAVDYGTFVALGSESELRNQALADFYRLIQATDVAVAQGEAGERLLGERMQAYTRAARAGNASGGGGEFARRVGRTFGQSIGLSDPIVDAYGGLRVSNNCRVSRATSRDASKHAASAISVPASRSLAR